MQSHIHTYMQTQHNSRSTTQHHAAPRSTTQHHAALRSTTQHHPSMRHTILTTLQEHGQLINLQAWGSRTTSSTMISMMSSTSSDMTWYSLPSPFSSPLSPLLSPLPSPVPSPSHPLGQGMQYMLDPVNNTKCRSFKVNGTMPLIWSWLSLAKYLGKAGHGDDEVDIWEARV